MRKSTALWRIFVLCLCVSSIASAQQSKPLISREGKPVFKAVTGEQRVEFETKSVKGELFDWTVSGSSVYDIRNVRGEFRTHIGVDDGATPPFLGKRPNEPSDYRIEIDGHVVAEGKVAQGEPPVPVTVKLSGGKSLGIHLSDYAELFNPRWVPLQPSSGGGAPPAQGLKPSLTAPVDNTTIGSDAVTFRWEPVPGATAYLIQVVMLESRTPASGSRGWAITAEGTTSYRWDISGLPNGSFLWSVLALGERKVISKFSAERLFIIDR